MEYIGIFLKWSDIYRIKTHVSISLFYYSKTYRVRKKDNHLYFKEVNVSSLILVLIKNTNLFRVCQFRFSGESAESVPNGLTHAEIGDGTIRFSCVSTRNW
jgi:hypothetical protein